MTVSSRTLGTVAVVVVMWVAITAFLVPRFSDLYALRRGHVSTVARIAAYEPKSHNRVTYVYRVGDQSYSGYSSASKLRENDELTIYYAVGAPWASSVQEPSRALRDAIAGFILLLAFVGVGVPLIASGRGVSAVGGLSLLVVAAATLLRSSTPLALGVVAALFVGGLAALGLAWVNRRAAHRLREPLGLR